MGIAHSAAASAASRNAGAALRNAALTVVTGGATVTALPAIVWIVDDIDADVSAPFPIRRANARAVIIANESAGTGRAAFPAAKLAPVGTCVADMVMALPHSAADAAAGNLAAIAADARGGLRVVIGGTAQGRDRMVIAVRRRVAVVAPLAGLGIAGFADGAHGEEERAIAIALGVVAGVVAKIVGIACGRDIDIADHAADGKGRRAAPVG